MKKSAFVTLSACALASIAVIRIKTGLRKIKHIDLTSELQSDQNPSGMFV
ncbi:MAG: hypothetical protein AB8G77_27430 [Rhodothermales bacterium]